jgi:zinc ribbon protein
MERCPNCGAPARPNANFCTTCGVRLPDDLAPAQPPTAEAAPTAPAPGNGWPPMDDQADAAASEPAAPESDQSATAETQPEPEIVIASESETTHVDQNSGEPTAATWSSTSAWPDWSTPAAEPALSESAGSEDEVQAPAAEPAIPPQPIEAGAAERALTLLDELRSLLPAVMASAPASASNGAIADALAAALAADNDDLVALRAAMDRARERPKDIDTVLDLSGRVDAVIALLDAYDRLRAAAETTVTQLRA